jgi:hypothetical protein
MENENAQEILTHGVLIDMSEIGLGVLVTAPFEVGTTVDLSLAEYFLVGSVINCIPLEPGGDADPGSGPLAEGGFRVGLELLHAISEEDWQGLLHSCGVSSETSGTGKVRAFSVLP